MKLSVGREFGRVLVGVLHILSRFGLFGESFGLVFSLLGEFWESFYVVSFSSVIRAMRK